MIRMTPLLTSFLITLLVSTTAFPQDKGHDKGDNRSSPIWKLFDVDRNYPNQEFRTISERDALRIAREFDESNGGRENERLILTLRKKFPDTPMQGIYLPDLNPMQCARKRDMVFITPLNPEIYPNPLDGGGGVVVGDLCSQDGEELCDNCSGCEGRDPVTGSYKTCVCTRSAKVCKACPSC